MQINPEAEQAILEADLITVGPGSLYTSILPDLLVEGTISTLKKSTAPKVYICNVATQRGETEGFSVADHLSALYDHVGHDVFDYVVVNSNLNYPLPASAVAAGTKPVLFDKTAQVDGVRVVLADVVSPQISTHHDPDRLARTLLKKTYKH